MAHHRSKRRPGDRSGAGFQGQNRRLTRAAAGAAVLLLDPREYVRACSARAEALLGYRSEELNGEHFCRLFFRPEEVRRGEPEYELHMAAVRGRVPVGRWYVRLDGTAWWCVGETRALRDRCGRLRGFAQVLRDLTGPKLQGQLTAERTDRHLAEPALA